MQNLAKTRETRLIGSLLSLRKMCPRSWSTAHRGPWRFVLFLKFLCGFLVISMGSGGWGGGGAGIITSVVDAV